VDTLQSIIEVLNTRLTTDGTLIALFPGGAVSLFYEWAEQDAAFPYIVLSIDTSADEWMETGDVVVNIWDSASEADRALSIRGRVRWLLYDYAFTAAEVGAARLGRPRLDQSIPDSEPGIWRREITFPIRFFDKQGVWA
jgi:hypothetical protein